MAKKRGPKQQSEKSLSEQLTDQTAAVKAANDKLSLEIGLADSLGGQLLDRDFLKRVLSVDGNAKDSDAALDALEVEANDRIQGAREAFFKGTYIPAWSKFCKDPKLTTEEKKHLLEADNKGEGVLAYLFEEELGLYHIDANPRRSEQRRLALECLDLAKPPNLNEQASLKAAKLRKARSRRVKKPAPDSLSSVPLPDSDMAAVTPARGGASPSSSPRLPSPPPFPEFQLGPQSPSATTTSNEVQSEAPNKPDASARRRIRPGTKAADMARGPPLVPLTQVDSAFPLQEHLKALYAHLTHGQSSTHIVPITKETAVQIAKPPQLEDGETADRNLWLYELCRFLTIKAGLVSVALMKDRPACSSVTCPEMRASEWQYLCAVHEPPKSCCAIDYVNHTLDWAANVLTSSKHFPSRLQLGGESGSIYQSMRQLTNIFRRVYRIFAHAWFQHREVFWHIEATQGIYLLFKTVCDEYHLIPDDNYTIPPEAEGPRDDAETPVNPSPPEMKIPSGGFQILRKDDGDGSSAEDQEPAKSESSSPPKDASSAATARRHRHTPSTGSHVTTIAEGAEDEDEVPPVPAIPSGMAATSEEGPATLLPSPSISSPERSTREALGRLDISGSASAFENDNQPEHPTPRTAHVSDPFDATSAATTEPKEVKKVELDTTVGDKEREKERRGSVYESEVKSPGGGSIRTAGTDMLGAILGHMDEKEREEREKELEDENLVDDGEETVLFIGEEDSEKKEDGTGADDDAAKEQNEEKAKVKDDDDPLDEDDNETMEEIKLPEKGGKEDDDAAPATTA